jgi:hypothetical protein
MSASSRLPLEDPPWRRTSRLVALIGAVAIGACGRPAPQTVNAPIDSIDVTTRFVVDSCRISVALDPRLHRLEGEADLELRDDDPSKSAPRKGICLALNSKLGLDEITSDGATVVFRIREPASQPTSEPADEGARTDVYELDWLPPRSGIGKLVLKYGGVLEEDIEAGEKAGEIHNLKVHAHVGTEGIYLSDEGFWYPQVVDQTEGLDQLGESRRRETSLARYELSVAPVPGMKLVATGNRTSESSSGGRITWRSPMPVPGMTLVGGPHIVNERRVGTIRVSTHLTADHKGFADGLLNAVESYLRLYQPLLGNYPYEEFTVVENFFSSGFAFPGFTVLSPAVIEMGPTGLRPGYLDHEMLHNWWGNGVLVSALDGNWCECLTSYCANYMRPILEGRPADARKQRRDTCSSLSRLTRQRDKPLAEFGRKDGPGQLIGYQKGTMLFAMLADQIGQDTMWRALRRLHEDRMGRLTNWRDIQTIIETESGQALGPFFDTWLRRSGMPDIKLDEAHYEPQAGRLLVTLTQEGDPPFEVSAPIRLIFDEGYLDERIALRGAAQVAVFKSHRAPKFVEFDPDFRILRKIPADQIMATIGGITDAGPLTIVRQGGDFKQYGDAADALRERYDKKKDDLHDIDGDELDDNALPEGHVLFLGRECLTPKAAAAMLAKGVQFGEGYFNVGSRRYGGPGHAILCCVPSEKNPAHVLCCYFGNSEKALTKASLIAFYGGNSLLIFDGGKVVHREDFEHTPRIAVEVGSP